MAKGGRIGGRNRRDGGEEGEGEIGERRKRGKGGSEGKVWKEEVKWLL